MRRTTWIVAALALAGATMGGCAANTKRFQVLEGRVSNQEMVAGEHSRSMGVLEARLEQARAREEELARLQADTRGKLDANAVQLDQCRSQLDEYRAAVDDYREAVDGVRVQQVQVLRTRLESVKRAIQALEEEKTQLEAMLSALEQGPPLPPPETDEDDGWERDAPRP